MSTNYSPLISAVQSFIPLSDGLQIAPPVLWHAAAADINAESGSGFSSAKYNESTGEIESTGEPTMQDTYLTGTAGRTGRAMTASAGTWKDDTVSPWSDKYCLLQPDATLATWAVADTTPDTTGLKNAIVILRMGIAPAGNAGAHTAATTYAYLELASTSLVNWRIALRFAQPICLEYTINGGSNWLAVAFARKLGSVENYLAHNKGEIRLRIRPDARRGIMAVEVGDGNWLRHSVARPAAPATPESIGFFPTIESYKFSGAYRWASIEVYPLVFGAITLTKGTRYFDQRRLMNMQGAEVVTNMAGDSKPTQSESLTLAPDGDGGLGYTLSSSNSDTTEPATLADVLIFIPSQWEFNSIGYPLPQVQLPSVRYRELSVWDDASRMGATSGRLLVNDRALLYQDTYGNYSVNIGCGNNQIYWQRLRGVLGCDPQGIAVSRQDPYRFVEFPVRDFWAKLEVPLCQDVILDGLCIFSAVRLLLDIGQVNPGMWAITIPDTGLPGPGGYGDGFPHYILGKGTGLNPKYRFGPEWSVIAVLQELIQDSGEPDLSRGVSVPHYMFFDAFGQFHFEPYDPSGPGYYPVHFYYTYDPTGVGQMYDVTSYNSVGQMRTEVILQGQDAFTYELLQYNIPLPGNIGAVGYQFRWLERNARYSTPAYMALIGRVAARQASLPSQILRFRAPYWPHVFAGQVIGVPEYGAGLFQVLEIDSTVGYDEVYTGPEGTHCDSIITARSLINAIPM